MFQVMDNNRRCNDGFEDLDEALFFADEYLGFHSPGVGVLRQNAIDVPYDYSGYGDTIEIREV